MSFSCDTETQVVDVTIGEADFLWPLRLTELTGQDITADTVTVAIGSQLTPGSFAAVSSPDVLTVGSILAGDFRRANPQIDVQAADLTPLYWVQVKLFIGSGGHALTPGDYYPYLKLSDNPATPIRRGPKFSVV